jgi:NADP-dependent 3-hydroxy acid dehydrogenase YdfG
MRLVFITGGSSGIGQAMATAYLQQGWRVALVARRLDALTAWATDMSAQLALSPDRLRVYGADVQNPDSIILAAGQCIAQMGLPDVVVANAGISQGVDTAEREDLAVMRQVMDTNVLGMAATFHPFIRAMQARGSGTLVGIASVAGIPLTERNRYPMPFLMQADDFAKQALRCIARGTSYQVIPRPMGVVAKLLRILPNAVFDRVLQGQPRKHRHSAR